jgi:uncharacterized protein (DUF1330 family)
VFTEFESVAAIKRCFESAEYVEAAAFRRTGAKQNELTFAESRGHTDG